MNVTPAAFVAFAQANYPDIYDEVSARWMVKPSGLGDDAGAGNSWNNLPDNTAGFLNELAQTILRYQQTRDLQKINAQRAADGLPPLDSNYQPVGGALGTVGGINTEWLLIGALAIYAAYSLGGKRR